MRVPFLSLLLAVATPSSSAWAAPRVGCSSLGPITLHTSDEGEVTGSVVTRWQVSGTLDQLSFFPPLPSALHDAHTLDDLRFRALDVPEPSAIAEVFAAETRGWRAREQRLLGRKGVGAVDEHGLVQLRTLRSRQAWVVQDNAVAFGGDVAGTARPSEVPGAPLDWVVSQHAQMLGLPTACNPMGDADFTLKGWASPLPVGEGNRLVYASDRHALLRGAGGPVWLFEVPAEQAAAAAAALQERWAPAPTQVVVQDGRALAAVGKWQHPSLEPVVPVAGDTWVVDLMREEPVPEIREATRQSWAEELPPLHEPGLEMVARLNQMRAAAGLQPVSLDADLMWSALGHCLYQHHAQEEGRLYKGHEQDADSAFFIGQWPSDRGGAAEVVARLNRDARPWQATEQWIDTPFHRQAPMHPQAVAAGACFLPSGHAVMEVQLNEDTAFEPYIYPVVGASDVPRAWDGHETPDPLPLKQHPDKTLPVGPVLTVWLDAAPTSVQLLDSWVSTADSTRVPHYQIWAETHSAAAGGADTPIHLIAERPLQAATAYSWGVVVNIAGAVSTLQGSFTTEAASLDAQVELSPQLQEVLDGLNQARQNAGEPRLRVTTSAQEMAMTCAEGPSWDVAVGALQQPGQKASLVDFILPSFQLAPSDFYGLGLGSTLAWIGVARCESEVVMVLLSDPLEPQPVLP